MFDEADLDPSKVAVGVIIVVVGVGRLLLAAIMPCGITDKCRLFFPPSSVRITAACEVNKFVRLFTIDGDAISVSMTSDDDPW